jgi:hypothetical protein
MALEVQDRAARLADPCPSRCGWRTPEREGLAECFGPSDPSPGLDLLQNPRVARLVRNRKFQFFLILPNQIISWTVIFVGLLGTTVPNFGNARSQNEREKR